MLIINALLDILAVCFFLTILSEDSIRADLVVVYFDNNV